MMESLSEACTCCLAFARVVWPYVLPPLVAIGLEAPLSLKTWLAVQDTPANDRDTALLQEVWNDGPQSSVDKMLQVVEKLALTHVAPAYLLGASLFGAYLQATLPEQIPAHAMTVYYVLTLGPLFVFAMWRFFALFSGVYSLGVYRDVAGDPRLSLARRSSLNLAWTVLPVVCSLSVTYGSIVCSNIFCTAVAHTALLQTLVSADTVATKSFRAMVLYALTNLATLVFLTFLLFFPSSPVFISPSSLPSLLGNLASSAPRSETHYPLLALAVLWNIFPTELAALCFHVDFARYMSRRAGEPVVPAVQEEDRYEDKVGPIYLSGEDSLSVYSAFRGAPLAMNAAVASSEPESELTPVPRRLPSFAPRPLFFTSVTTQLLTSLFLLALTYASARSVSPVFCAHRAGAAALAHVGPLVPLVSVPASVLAVAAIAMVLGGGEGRKLWRYTEVWSSLKGTCTCQRCQAERAAKDLPVL